MFTLWRRLRENSKLICAASERRRAGLNNGGTGLRLIDFLVRAEINENSSFGVLEVKNDPQVIFHATTPLAFQSAGKFVGSQPNIERIVHKQADFGSQSRLSLRAGHDLSLERSLERRVV